MMIVFYFSPKTELSAKDVRTLPSQPAASLPHFPADLPQYRAGSPQNSAGVHFGADIATFSTTPTPDNVAYFNADGESDHNSIEDAKSTRREDSMSDDTKSHLPITVTLVPQELNPGMCLFKNIFKYNTVRREKKSSEKFGHVANKHSFLIITLEHKHIIFTYILYVDKLTF